ncbi:MAG: glycoside hydrolase family protein [Synoicihabitans sp.]
MKVRYSVYWIGLFLASGLGAQNHGESAYRVPDGLVRGAAFKDLFLPQPLREPLRSNLWGTPEVLPRDAANGIEDAKWSYWGGNVIPGSDGREHLFVCRWLESSAKGHFEYHDSEVVHAVADDPLGPFVVQSVIGQGHNPEAYRTKDGTWALFVNEAVFLADRLEGPWRESRLGYEFRDTPNTRLVNHTFAPREDGSVLLISRQGQVWVSEDGLRPFHKLTTQHIYPPVDGKYEDPVVWRDEVQYHLIVNDWYGRIAYYLRSPDGVHWHWDDGAAYDPEVIRREDGTVEGWYKLERPKVRQDKFGRATHMYFAVIDYPKHDDLGNDSHSSKNVAVPVTIGRRLEILTPNVTAHPTGEIKVRVKAESSFSPHRDLDLASLRFGDTRTVNLGGGAEVTGAVLDGVDLILTFTGEHGLKPRNFAAKLIGADQHDALVFGYARIPEFPHVRPLLFGRPPRLMARGAEAVEISLPIDNFGQLASAPTLIDVELKIGDHYRKSHQAISPGVPAYLTKRLVTTFQVPPDDRKGPVSVSIVIDPHGPYPESQTFSGGRIR